MRAPVVLLTRAEADNAPLARLLEDAGVRARSYPCIAIHRVVPEPDRVASIRNRGPLDAIAFSSRRAVEGLAASPETRAALDLDPERLTVGAVGEATARAARAAGWPAPLVPESAVGSALAALLAARLTAKARVLIPCGDRPRQELPEGLRDAGMVPELLLVYAHQPVHPPPLPEAPAVVVIASPSAGETFLAANPEHAGAAFVAIGPTTGAALRRLGARDVQLAASPRAEDLVRAVLGRIAEGPPPRQEARYAAEYVPEDVADRVAEDVVDDPRNTDHPPKGVTP